MSRIDEALRRAGEQTRTPAATAGASAAATDAFVAPWAFPQDAPNDSAMPPPVSAPDPVLDLRPRVVRPARPETLGERQTLGPLALFRDVNSQLAGRIVGTTGVPALMTEQFRRLAATLHHAQLVQGTKIVMVTSATPGDGKTLTAANLGLTLSESYRREVLLIDADLRRPWLHEVFGVPNVAGLNDGLQASRDGKLSVIQLTDRLTLLPAGRPDPDPMGTLTSARMAQILRESANRFDWVVVDTAPVGLLTDANLLTTMVDGALLVIRASVTPFDAVSRAVESLGRDRVLGVVLNAVEPDSQPAHYARYYNAHSDELALHPDR